MGQAGTLAVRQGSPGELFRRRREYGLKAGVNIDGNGSNVDDVLIAHRRFQHQAAMRVGTLLVENKVAEAVSNPVIVVLSRATAPRADGCPRSCPRPHRSSGGQAPLGRAWASRRIPHPNAGTRPPGPQGAAPSGCPPAPARGQATPRLGDHTCRRFLGVNVHVGEESDAEQPTSNSRG